MPIIPRAETACGLGEPEGRAGAQDGLEGGHEAASSKEQGSASSSPNLGLRAQIPALALPNRRFAALSRSCLICK